jgi:general secretion pathway protein L
MFELIQKPWRRLRARYEKSGLAIFLRWWRDELVGALPPRWREWLAPDPIVLTIEPVDAGWRLRRLRGGRLEQEDHVEREPEALVRALGRISPGADTLPHRVLLVPAGETLRRRIVLPAAAEEHLGQVLSYEMDRYTPFRADQVYFDFRIQRRDEAARQLAVELLVIPRGELDARLATLPAALDAADVAEGGQPAGFNLLPANRRARRIDRRARLNLILAGGAALLLWLVMTQSLALREQALEALGEEVAAARRAASQSAELKRQLRDAIEGANFLARRKAEQPVVVDVLAEVTRRLPDDTWLQRLTFTGNRVQLQGQSARADKLIGILTESKCLANPQFQGIIQPDGATGKERFSLAAELKTGACYGDDPVAAAR